MARAGVAVLTLLLLPACVKRGDTRVSMKPVEADLVFGVTPPNQPPPVFAPADVPTSGSGSGASGPPALEDLGVGFSKPRPRIGVSQVACPAAALNAFPDKEASRTSESLPVQGLYRWKRGGEYWFDQAPDRKIPYSGFENRTVFNVKQVADASGVNGLEYTFQSSQPTFLGQEQTSSWHLKAAPKASATARELTVNSPSVGDPERGLALEKLDVTTKDGTAVSSYSFPTGVLYLPLPVTAGTQWSSAAVDPRSGVTLSMDAKVIDKARVDACGEIVDGYRVEATQTFSGTESRTITYNYIVATQLGGVLVYEQSLTHTTGAAAGQYNLDSTLGQVKPDPLPAEEAP